MAQPIIADKQAVEQIFDGAAARYDREGPAIFREAGARLVELLDIPAGSRLLDVATGTGAALIPASRRVGPAGRVVGIDLSAGMLREAEQAARAAGLGNVEFHKMDAERLESPDASFDGVICSFSIFFFPGLEAALGEMRRVSKPGGRLGVSAFGRTPAPFEPAWRIFAEQAQAYDVVVRPPQRVAYLPEELRSLLAHAGFSGVEVRAETGEAVYATEDEWWAFQLTLANRAAILRMDEETRGRFRTEYLARVRPLFQADGLHLPFPALFATAVR